MVQPHYENKVKIINSLIYSKHVDSQAISVSVLSLFPNVDKMNRRLSIYLQSLIIHAYTEGLSTILDMVVRKLLTLYI